MAKNFERRILQSYGSRYRVDIQNPDPEVGGPQVFQQQATTDEDDTLSVGMDQKGLYHIYNDKTIEIVGGARSEQDGPDIVITGKHGDIFITAEENGRIRIRGKGITIQADEDLNLIGGRNVNIKSGSGRVLMAGNTLEKDGLKGNLLEPDQQWAYKVFDGTGLPADKFSQLTSKFSGITDLAGDIVKSPDIFSSFVQDTIKDAIGGFTGGLTDGLF